MVRAKGLEPPHLSILEPKSSASTNSATPARTLEVGRTITGGPPGQPASGAATRRAPRRSTFKENIFVPATAVRSRAARPARSANPQSCAVAAGPADPCAGGGAGAESEHRRAFAANAGYAAADDADLARGLTISGSSLRGRR